MNSLRSLKDRHSGAIQKARVLGIACSLSLEDWLLIVHAYNGKCYYCGKQAEVGPDHIVPLSKGGEHSATNVVPSCRSCNARKGNRDYLWYIADAEGRPQATLKVIQGWCGAAVVRLPREIATALNLTPGSMVRVTVTNSNTLEIEQT